MKNNTEWSDKKKLFVFAAILVGVMLLGMGIRYWDAEIMAAAFERHGFHK